MSPVERVLESELLALLDRLADELPPGVTRAVAASHPTLRTRLDDAEARLAESRATLLAEYGRWRRALEDVENLWALASWRSAAQEPAEPAATAVAA